MKLDEMGIVSLDGYDFSKYFAPEIILPFQSSRGCYWGKCSFCDQDFGQNFNVKNVEKLTDEFIELKEKYGIKYFEFIDESVSPAYLSELADKIKEIAVMLQLIKRRHLFYAELSVCVVGNILSVLADIFYCDDRLFDIIFAL